MVDGVDGWGELHGKNTKPQYDSCVVLHQVDQ
jgi:hypothetical protein